MLEPLTINLLATGIAAGTGVTATTVRRALRQRRISDSIGDVATEFNDALQDAIRAEHAHRGTNELAEITTDWGAVAEELAATTTAPDADVRRDREEVDILFEDEAAAVERLIDAIATVHDDIGAAIEADPTVRKAVETALTRAYRRAVATFERRIADDDELATVLRTETDLELLDRLRSLRGRLERLEADVDRLLTQDVRNEGFRQLSANYFARTSPSPESCWRTTFSLADVHAGVPAPRTGTDDGTDAHVELRDSLRAGEDRIVVGPPGAGKSTLCKQVAVDWYREDNTGPVLYRESGYGAAFESPGALADAIDRASGHVLIVVEDAVREEANAVLPVIEGYADDPSVSFLLDARRAELDDSASGDATDRTRRRLVERLDRIRRYALPAVRAADIARVVEAFEAATGRTVDRDAATLHEAVTGGGAGEFGAFLLLSFHLPVGGDTLDGDDRETGLEAHVRARYETLDPDGDGGLRDLSRFDGELLADVGVMVNLLNAAGIGVHPELVHALGAEYGHDPATHDEIADIRRALEGWFLYPSPSAQGPVRTTHELWSTLYLRQVARDHAAQQASSRRRQRSEPRVARCLDALFAVCDDESERAALAREFPASGLLDSVADDPAGATEEYVRAVFGLGERWPVLAPLYGTTRTARYTLPEACPSETRGWVVATRGHAHCDRGAYDEARSEYEQRLADARTAGDRAGEAESLNFLGLVARDRGDYETARDYHQRSLELFRDLENRLGEAKSLANLGTVAVKQGEYEAAREFLRDGLGTFRALGNRSGEASCLGNLGVIAQLRGEYEAAREFHRRNREIKRDLGNRVHEASCLSNLGVVATRQGNYGDARDYHQRSLEIRRDLGDRPGEATSLTNLGLIARKEGDYEAAREYHRHSLDIKREIGDRNGEATSLNNLGLVVRELGDYEAARDYHQQGLERFRELGDRAGEAGCLDNLGIVARKQGDYETARDYHHRSLEIERDLGNPAGEASSLGSLGRTAGERGDHEAAREHFRSALEIHERLGRIREEAKDRRNLVLIETAAGEYDRARECCEAAFRRLESSDRDLPGERRALAAVCEDIPEE